MRTIFYFAAVLVFFCENGFQSDPQDYVHTMVRNWTHKIGMELGKLMGTTKKTKLTKTFSKLKSRTKDNQGDELLKEIKDVIEKMMIEKEEAVKLIAKHAEFLAEHRKQDPIDPNDYSFDFYNADNITKTTSEPIREDILEKEILQWEYKWCTMKSELTPDMIPREIEKLYPRHCNSLDFDLVFSNYTWLPLSKHPGFSSEVNLNLSVAKIATHIYQRDQEVLQGIRWSAPLDLAFKYNSRRDKTMTYQYFASPSGFMRHYPALQWSISQYLATFDPRTRSWYTEAMTSAKDMIILLDRSGSNTTPERLRLASHIVNNILDTLNDNDFVNIYTFSNFTQPLVECFEDLLVPANEENLRLLRESIPITRGAFTADIALGLRKAFEILGEYRNSRASSQCNQVIMLVTEGLDYDMEPAYQILQNNTSVRLFTYQIDVAEGDAQVMEHLACNNQGYFVNISLPQEVRDKVLSYINAMSRSINLERRITQKPIWSYLQIDLADRRYSNYLWKKFEGYRQREVFLDHLKRKIFRQGYGFTSHSHVLLQDSHDYMDYKERRIFDYLTTVSLPVYGKRPEDMEIIGVAGVDVPITLINSLIPHHKLGVNGYAFIITNNGYILMHPRHRKEFENIPKPTFNRVDLLEVEIMDDDALPRNFGQDIIGLRNKMVQSETGTDIFNVKTEIDGMRRIILSKRIYHYTPLGDFKSDGKSPFSLGIALPFNYGLLVVGPGDSKTEYWEAFEKHKKGNREWTVHPNWIYCNLNKDENVRSENPEDAMLRCKKQKSSEHTALLKSLLFDAYETSWYEESISDQSEKEMISKFKVSNIFMATYSGLTRWKNFTDKIPEENTRGNKAIDEDWYKRVVEENFQGSRDMFVYSVPFEISGFENDTLVTSTSAIFVSSYQNNKIPLAAVGLQFSHEKLIELYKNITVCADGWCCSSEYLSCFVLDNNGYIIVSDKREQTGRFIGDIRPDIMGLLLKSGTYQSTKMYDYQSICYKPPKLKGKNASNTLSSMIFQIYKNLTGLLNWTLSTILFLLKTALMSVNTQSPKIQRQRILKQTEEFDSLVINKTYPTPCDQEMHLFTFGTAETKHNIVFPPTACGWRFLTEHIPNSNLLFLVINECKSEPPEYENYQGPTLNEINYLTPKGEHVDLPCYIATNNTFTRRSSMRCYRMHEKKVIKVGLAKSTTSCQVEVLLGVFRILFLYFYFVYWRQSLDEYLKIVFE